MTQIAITALAAELGVDPADVVALAGQIEDSVADDAPLGRIDAPDGVYTDVTLTDEAADLIRAHIAQQ